MRGTGVPEGTRQEKEAGSRRAPPRSLLPAVRAVFGSSGGGSCTHKKGGEGVVVTEKARKIKKKYGVPAAVWRRFADG